MRVDHDRRAHGSEPPHGALAFDVSRLPTFNVVQAADPAELDSQSRVSDRFPTPSRMYKYRLRDRALWRMRFDAPIFGLAIRCAGGILASHGENRFATDIAIDGEADDYYGFATIQRGRMTLVQNGDEATGSADHGLAYRTGADTRFAMGDECLRTNVFLKVGEVTRVLEHLLDARLREPLQFRPTVDWTDGLAASLRRQLDVVMEEFGRPDGMADNAVALASMTDLLTRLVLVALPHNHSDQLGAGKAGAIPVYVRRAEDFMRAQCAEPLRMVEVAAAAGCSVRTLEVVFRQFRGTSPLGALHGIRLEQVRRTLIDAATDEPIIAIARRHGFTNRSRFVAAYRRRFGESPFDVVRRASRS
ncbi:AraC family transcriptional regulator [Roseomonas fluvialis]|uniref:AraC family transcriptional regulator n=1 Tax=Roseomonas fluvialis TaxID=1750527 RepID=A0ABN6P467_9PROT|nr:AraC family transcriptional regulator [Roseomonas fluvialis]